MSGEWLSGGLLASSKSYHFRPRKSPANKLKRNAIASDWTTATTGFWNTSAQPNGNIIANLVHRSSGNKYGKQPGYDASISYTVVASQKSRTFMGRSVALTPSYLLSWDYNVNTTRNSDRTGYPNINPIPGGGMKMNNNLHRNYVRDNSADSPLNGWGGQSMKLNNLGFVMGRISGNERYELHGGQRGNIVRADASVLQVGVFRDFQIAASTMDYELSQTRGGEDDDGPDTSGDMDNFRLYSPY